MKLPLKLVLLLGKKSNAFKDTIHFLGSHLSGTVQARILQDDCRLGGQADQYYLVFLGESVRFCMTQKQPAPHLSAVIKNRCT